MPSGPSIALTVAGFDPSSGAGITADLQTFAAHGLFGTSAITALTVQSTLGVAAVSPIAPELLRHTLDHLTADLPPHGIKLGMLGSPAIAQEIASYLRAGNYPLVVLDPVLLSSSGRELYPLADLPLLHAELLPAIHWVTPNWPELSALTGLPVTSLHQAATAAHHLGQLHPHLHIVATGGDHTQPTDLLRLPTGELHTFPGEHIPTTSTHGTGCAFSSALLSNLVLGLTPTDAVAAAKHYVTQALRLAPGIGQGRGPLNLLWPLTQATTYRR